MTQPFRASADKNVSEDHRMDLLFLPSGWHYILICWYITFVILYRVWSPRIDYGITENCRMEPLEVIWSNIPLPQQYCPQGLIVLFGIWILNFSKVGNVLTGMDGKEKKKTVCIRRGLALKQIAKLELLFCNLGCFLHACHFTKHFWAELDVLLFVAFAPSLVKSTIASPFDFSIGWTSSVFDVWDHTYVLQPAFGLNDPSLDSLQLVSLLIWMCLAVTQKGVIISASLLAALLLT